MHKYYTAAEAATALARQSKRTTNEGTADRQQRNRIAHSAEPNGTTAGSSNSRIQLMIDAFSRWPLQWPAPAGSRSDEAACAAPYPRALRCTALQTASRQPTGRMRCTRNGQDDAHPCGAAPHKLGPQGGGLRGSSHAKVPMSSRLRKNLIDG